MRPLHPNLLITLTSGFICFSFFVNSAHAAYTRLVPVPPPRVVTNAEAYPGGRHEAVSLVDGNPQTEYSSNGKGLGTFLELDFGAPRNIVAFQHIDRNDPATIAASEITFIDANGRVVATKPVTHVNQKFGSTFVSLRSPILAKRVKWRVTKLGSGHTTVGGAELTFFTPGQAEREPSGIAWETRTLQMLERKGSVQVQPVRITVDYPYAEPMDGTLAIAGAESKPIRLQFGKQTLDLAMPAVEAETLKTLELASAGKKVKSSKVTIKPVRKFDIYLLPHSHVDIGYTALQADVEKKQNENIEIGLRLAQATAKYPVDARFKWNMEVLWPVDNYLRTASPEKREAFIAAVRSGKVGLDAFYGNILTGLCRPEELIRMMRYATEISAACGVPIESAMISDVPGYTWSTVSAMAEAGVRYFSFAPNYFDRMGGTMKEWQNKPFWWRGPDRRERVLCWCPSRGYALGHLIGDGEALARFLPDYLVELENNNYPYDISHLRWNVHGDNGSPDERVADVVRDWNAKYVYPRLILAATAEAFRAFEKRYGDQLPEYSGDYTPYWEDGAGSSALETAMNRASAERLVQAETLWALRDDSQVFPAREFNAAWRNVLLYSEHTWGAHNSISEPDIPFVKNQWKVKQAFALDADKQSRRLLEQVCVTPNTGGNIEVFNTASWPRTDLVTLSAGSTQSGDKVVDEKGRIVPSQRLSTGELAFLAKQVPPFGSRVYSVSSGEPGPASSVKAEGNRLTHPEFTVVIDESTGGISSLFSERFGKELVNRGAPAGLNDYFYLPGADVKKVARNGKPRITVKEAGPLVASLLIESEAPGCKRLVREVRVIDGIDRIELINLVDKLPVRTKEGLHFGFGFNVPQGETRMDVGLAQVRPEIDQIPASCKNWFSVQRWVDIANEDFGVTWSSVDAPLVQLGGITANLIGSQTDWRVWIQRLEPSQTLYSWVMNNHWHTNYRADQEGPTIFRFAIRPHGRFIAEDAARFGLSCSQPLLVSQAADRKGRPSRLKLSTDNVVVTALKPSDDGKATIVRLFGASGRAEIVKLAWSDPAPKRIWISDTSERPMSEANNTVDVPGWGVVTLRAE